MREIKFRAWHNEKKEYCDGRVSDMFSWLEGGQPMMLEQSTGLKDKNGVEIYEGDIVHCSSFNDGCNHFVYYEEDEGAWFILCSHDSYIEMMSSFIHEIEVIGNIHQNPELLGY